MTSPPAAPPAARPRTRNVPTYSTSAGHEAADLAASAGLILDGWQRDALVDALGEREDGRWAAFEVAIIVARQNGKGAILEARELAGLFLFGERLILHSAHEYKTAMEAFRRLLALIEATADLSRRVKKVVNTNGEEGVELTTGARLRFAARSKGSGRGFSADCVIWDEAYALTSQHVEAQLPTLSARPNPQLWYTSSPPLDAASGEVLIGVRQRGIAGDNGLCYLDWGAKRGVDVDDRAEWAAANPGYGIRISEEFVARERAAMTKEGFARERLCVWPPTADEQWQVIGKQAWDDACDPESRRDGKICLSVEMSRDRQWTVLSVAGARADGLRHVEVIESERGTGWVVPRVIQLRDKHQPCAIVINPGGPAGALIPDLEAAGVDLVKMTEREVAQAYGGFVDGVAGPMPEDPDEPSPRVVRHRGQPVLTTAIAGAVDRKSGSAKTWDPDAAAVDISPAIGAANALWGYATHGHTEPPAPWAVYA